MQTLRHNRPDQDTDSLPHSSKWRPRRREQGLTVTVIHSPWEALLCKIFHLLHQALLGQLIPAFADDVIKWQHDHTLVDHLALQRQQISKRSILMRYQPLCALLWCYG